MIQSRLALFPTTLALALAACAPSDGEEGERPSGPPGGYELATSPRDSALLK